ncbi:ectonucleotide pyrophosphatase/phosphodiesterase [Pedobacter sp. KR3-3]|uniref:Ectonucleotide pyrophosphatase/phosphodiesterase n=1 Tax=Pedobacter albus TaxID=3113905 RepID=A0ABU7I255_9SPHI|nr:ectonucleotide pyrophosphatase/phosphodiesterase [Pedobacter sp. KR3-3]MEE1943542.1 ectonucleotide pyrophosphatase/phosphodiesterase [Pedobacter sp. KR3-3]
MKNILFSLLLCCGLSAMLKAQENHVIVISVDGLRPEFYMDPNWAMVNLRQAMQTGSYAQGVRGVFPTVTYPSHTTILTGVKPSKHGIYYNTPVEPLGISGKWYWDYSSIKVPTIWSAAKQAGLTTACVGWPVTLGAPITYNLPEYWYLPKNKGEQNDEIKALADVANPKGLFEEVQELATGKLGQGGADLDYYSSDENKSRMASYLIQKYKPSFLAIHIAQVDHFEHEEGREGPKVRSAVAGADRAIKTIIDAVEKAGIKKNTTIIVTGDHGFVDVHTQVTPNVLLAKAGLYDPAKKDSWKAYFHASGGSAFLHLKDPKDKATLDKVKSILNGLTTGQKRLFKVVDRTALDEVGADPNAALALTAEQGVSFGPSAEGELVKPGKGGTHGYFPDFKEIQTGFVVFGKGIKPGVVIPQMGEEDIAPIIAKLLAFDFPSADGVLYQGLFTK